MKFMWQDLKENTPNIHDGLKNLSLLLYERGEVTIDSAHFSSSFLEELLDLGFVVKSEEKISFKDLELLADYLIQHASEQISTSWSDESRVLEFYGKISRFQTLGNPSFGTQAFATIESKLLLTLVIEYGRNISELVVRTSHLRNDSELGRSFQRLHRTYWEIASDIGIDSHSAIEIIDGLGKDYVRSSSYIAKSVEEISTSNKAFRDAIYGLLLDEDRKLIAGLLYYVLVAMSKTEIEKAHEKALLLSNEAELTVKRAGIRALGTLDYNHHQRHDLLPQTLSRLEVLTAEMNPQLIDVLIGSYEDLIGTAEEVESKFLELAAHSNKQIRQSCLFSLFRKARQLYKEKWYKDALHKLIQMHRFNGEELHYLDECLEHYVDDDSSFVLDMIEQIKLDGDLDLKSQCKRITEKLRETFSALQQNRLATLESALTRWIASTDMRLHILAFSLNDSFRSIPVKVGNQLERDRQPTFKFSKDVLDTLSNENAENVVYRTLAYTSIDAPSASNFLLSILRKSPISDEIISLVKQLLVSQVLFNFPQEAKEFIESELQSGHLSNLQVTVARAALADFQDYIDAREGLPELKEFQISTRRAYLYRIADQRRQSQARQDAESRSVLNQFFPERLYLYGRSVAYEDKKGFSEPMPLISTSVSAEMPHGEFIDPVGQACQRIIWMNAGLPIAEAVDTQKEEENK